MRLRATSMRGGGGVPDFVPPSGNAIASWRGTGTGGASGLPDGWSAATIAGVVLSVLSRTPYRGGVIIEAQFAGTATASGAIYIIPGGFLAASVAPGQFWRPRLFSERVGSATPGDLACNIHWRNASSVYLGAGPGAALNGNITGPEIAPADGTAPATAAYAAMSLNRSITSGQAVSLRYRIFAPTLVRVS